jgi:hypothetical protein
MKKIIDGKMFNTETAIKIGRTYCRSETVLYKKNNDEYFFYYQSMCDGDITIDIRKADLEEVKEWSTNVLGVEKYEAAFGKVEE